MTERELVNTRKRKKMAEAAAAKAALDYNARFDSLDSKLNKLLEVSTSTKTLLDSAVKRIEALEERMESAEAEMHDHSVKAEMQEKKTEELEKQLKNALTRIEQLENRHRQNNLRLLNVPENMEGGRPMSTFLVKIFEEKWNLKLKEEDFERAHRVGPVRDTAAHPRAIIFKLHHFQKKLHIWRETRGQPQSCNFKVVSDMSATVRAMRQDWWPLREQLHSIDVKTFLRFPATLHVEDGGQVMTFTSLEKAKVELRKKYPSLK